MEITMQYIISQVFTIISYIILGTTYYVKGRRTVLILNCALQCTFMVAYVLLGAWSGLAMAIVALIRNCFFIVDENKNGKRDKINKTDIIILAVMYIISIISAIFTYEGFLSLFPVFATMIYTYGVCQKNMRIYKLLGIPIEVLWVCYNIYIKSLFGTVLEVVMLGVCTLGYIIEVHKKK